MKNLFCFLLIAIVMSCTPETTYPVGQIKTDKGDILIWLYDETPNHKEAFIELAEEGYWNDYTFNRVIENFVAQGGCPDTPEGFAYSTHLLEPEFDPIAKHVYGAFGAGRDGNPGKISATCQFYIVQNEKGLPRLDGDYTIYGQVFKGMDVVDQIVKVEKDSTNAPLVPIKLDVSVVQMTAAQIEAEGYTMPVKGK
ncbi:peptidylprolyl isomerase [Roseivirga echinicomitans]|uniref:Peptidyl-prolyl cis-trans isomerase n=2 Tax=Roseivirga echinicomitans TaxID=296218 RepID=A0A150X3E6_9BACT|nr:peptidylprolyl isomerase [Roseivirga echinicomitans]